MESYDEDIYENKFFKCLKTNYHEIFKRAIAHGWIICIPRSGSLQQYPLSEEHYFSHILVPSDELPNSHFRTLSDKNVLFQNSQLIETDLPESEPINILFNETFYDEQNYKYKVYCIESLLYSSHFDAHTISQPITTLQSLGDCVDFLLNESDDPSILSKINTLIYHFSLKNAKLEYESLQYQQEVAFQLYSECVQIVLNNFIIKEKSSNDPYYLELIKLSVESYVIHGIYKKVIKGITACTACDDSRLNHKIRNLSDIHIRELKINATFASSINNSKLELSNFGNYSTPLVKLICLNKAIESINSTSEEISLTTDDLLPIIIFLIVKSSIGNWYANLAFLKLFRFSSSDTQSTLHEYNISSLEAALEHIQSGALFGSNIHEADCISQTSSPTPTKNIELTVGYDGDDPLSIFFESIRLGKLEDVEQLLTQTCEKDYDTTDNAQTLEDKLCHPLCSCDKCESVIKKTKHDIISIYSKDEKGSTALHIAAYYGRPNIVDLLIIKGASVNAEDYKGASPLHCAALRGHQNALLLLLHAGAEINKQDNELNTPLHLASLNGHDGCVKALLFYSESVGCALNLNCQNINGNTALHYASKWGYFSIVELLLEKISTSDLSLNVLNKRKLTPLECAHNIHISSKILETKTKIDQSSMVNKFIRIGFNSEKNHLHNKQPSGKNNQFNSETLSPQKSKQIDKLMKAVVLGDSQLVCYYLGIDEKEKSLQTEGNTKANVKLCHPLCQCSKCSPNTRNKDQKHVIPINSINQEGRNALHFAVSYNQKEIYKILKKHGCNINEPTNHKKSTPLHIAAEKRNLDMMQLLLSDGAYMDPVDIYGNTPMHSCCINGFTEGVKILLMYGASADILNRSENTAVVEAEYNGHWSVVQLIVIFGPMFSGKTTELLRRIKRYQIANHRCLAIKYSKDVRYKKDAMSTHDKDSLPAVSLTELSDLKENANDYDVIGVDEGQFFPDIVKFSESMANSGKIVIIAALDGTYQREGFRDILNLVPLAESVVKLSAICNKCFGEASYTKRKTRATAIEVIGGTETYEASCRECYFIETPRKKMRLSDTEEPLKANIDVVKKQMVLAERNDN